MHTLLPDSIYKELHRLSCRPRDVEREQQRSGECRGLDETVDGPPKLFAGAPSTNDNQEIINGVWVLPAHTTLKIC